MSENEDENPYAAPVIVTNSPATSAWHFRPAGPLAAMLCGCLIVYGMIRMLQFFVAVVFDISVAGPDPTSPTGQRMSAVILIQFVASLLSLVIYLASVIVFCCWIERAGKNSRALGALGMKFLPGWRAGWFFIPIANFWKPYQAVCEVYLASDPESFGTGWRRPGNVVPAFFGWWWTAWIGIIFLTWLEGNFRRSMDRDFHLLANCVSYFTSPTACAAALLCVAVIRAIERRQAEKFARISTGALPREGVDRV